MARLNLKQKPLRLPSLAQRITETPIKNKTTNNLKLLTLTYKIPFTLNNKIILKPNLNDPKRKVMDNLR